MALYSWCSIKATPMAGGTPASLSIHEGQVIPLTDHLQHLANFLCFLQELFATKKFKTKPNKSKMGVVYGCQICKMKFEDVICFRISHPSQGKQLNFP